jgi:signal transduction histidine kinase
MSNDELTSLSVSLNRMAKTLSENILELEKRNAELDQFAYIVSHDLKAPLRGIQNVIDWIEEDLGSTLESKMKEFLAMIKGRLKRMEGLIEGILEFSRIGRGKRSIENVDLQQLFQEIIELLAPPPKFKIELPAKLSVIKTEKIALHQVICNLISNAIKYNDKDRGIISIEFQEEREQYRFCISDNGPGISPKYHKKIFGIFQTLVEKDAFESTGIGLSIVKKILDEAKSTIDVDSDVGKGASFSFTWPKIEYYVF